MSSSSPALRRPGCLCLPGAAVEDLARSRLRGSASLELHARARRVPRDRRRARFRAVPARVRADGQRELRRERIDRAIVGATIGGVTAASSATMGIRTEVLARGCRRRHRRGDGGQQAPRCGRVGGSRASTAGADGLPRRPRLFGRRSPRRAHGPSLTRRCGSRPNAGVCSSAGVDRGVAKLKAERELHARAPRAGRRRRVARARRARRSSLAGYASAAAAARSAAAIASMSSACRTGVGRRGVQPARERFWSSTNKNELDQVVDDGSTTSTAGRCRAAMPGAQADRPRERGQRAAVAAEHDADAQHARPSRRSRRRARRGFPTPAELRLKDGLRRASSRASGIVVVAHAVVADRRRVDPRARLAARRRTSASSASVTPSRLRAARVCGAPSTSRSAMRCAREVHDRVDSRRRWDGRELRDDLRVRAEQVGGLSRVAREHDHLVAALDEPYATCGR